MIPDFLHKKGNMNQKRRKVDMRLFPDKMKSENIWTPENLIFPEIVIKKRQGKNEMGIKIKLQKLS